MNISLSIQKHSKILTILIHCCFWMFFFFMPQLLFGIPTNTPIIIARTIELAVLIFLFYTNALFLVPRFLISKKYIIYFAIILTIIIGGSHFGSLVKAKYFPKPDREFYHDFRHNSNTESSTYTDTKPKKSQYRIHTRYFKPRPGFLSIIILITIAISSVYGYALNYNSREKRIKEFETEKLSSELSFLKSQINQHFLFNVLNSIYSLSLKKSDALPSVILKLSDLLRYMTYDTEDEFVDIQNEIQYLQNYIDLQKLRLGQTEAIHFEIHNQTEKSITIAPLILVPFIENAFKHGTLSDDKTNIDIQLFIHDKTIELTVQNTFTEKTQKDTTHGVGIQNVKRRLELLYPRKNTLTISQEKQIFQVNLLLNHSS
ncbi:MAG: histidine kinase [Bacteroidales bacterium]|jgi:two-component system LytT family sensor kinase|nr:histidine kinase [Bacteroidales bacterium]